MNDSTHQKALQDFLYQVVSQKSASESTEWLSKQSEKYREQPRTRNFYLTFSMMGRHFDKTPLSLDPKDEREAQRLRPGWDLSQWTVVQAARTYWLLQLSAESFEEYRNVLDRLFATADIDEQVTLYASLPVLAYPEELAYRASEGVRTNITDVFDAIALRNPYPAEHLEDAAWNQMVLKAIFMGRPLYLIQGLDHRRNPSLARMMVDFAHERWAAQRPVTPELWRGAAPYLSEANQDDIRRLLDEGTELEKQAAVLASWQSTSSALRELAEGYSPPPDELNWDAIGQQYNAQTT